MYVCLAKSQWWTYLRRAAALWKALWFVSRNNMQGLRNMQGRSLFCNMQGLHM